MKRALIFTVVGLAAVAGMVGAGHSWNQHRIGQARAPLLNVLRDPSSAQFRNERFNADNGVVCGEYNAKNGMGGYSGFKHFISTATGPFAMEDEPLVTWRGDATQYKIADLERATQIMRTRRLDTQAAIQEAFRQEFEEIWAKSCPA